MADPNSQAHPDSPSELRKEINETTVIGMYSCSCLLN